MGNCIYCMKPAGFLRKKHHQCEQTHEAGKKEIIDFVSAALSGPAPADDLIGKLKSIAETCYISEKEYKKLLVQGWEAAVAKALDDGILSKDEESQLVHLLTQLSLSQNDVNSNGAYTKVAQAAVLRDLMEGKLPDRVTVQGSLPFNFQKSEQLVWLFKEVNYFEQKTRREYVGGYQGASIRVAKGLYFRVGGFRGRPVESSENVHVDTGLLGITNKHVYFAGPMKSFRIPYDKIVSMTPYSDGVGIQRDAASAKPQSFVMGDGWFIYNLLMNLTKI